ncbi:PhzF family phenazine biosynthesis protein [Herbaspirillum sp. RV1423]|uniref:PhzF family phenazine biosynthesis protein n=1 Tax=Herbaspirillum sp. RV1423 TaxID=1443993 RepID=UPI0004B0B548|nr:PhzF family phenazine biosynthesis protein [Herbaspirillum sp. RV1423]
MQVDAQIVNAFIDGAAGGNPAGVVLDADALTTGQKLHIARQLGLSETAFVSASQSATVKLEFFTPTRQIPHCGHATIATFSLLHKLGMVNAGKLSKETIDGNRGILIDGDLVFMEQRAPQYRTIAVDSELTARIAASLGIMPQRFHARFAPAVVNTGNAFLVLALPDEQAVSMLRPDFRLIEALSNELDVIGYYVFSDMTAVSGRHAGVRMFAPRFGIAEESATGTAAGPLACYLHDHAGVRDRELFIEQGYLMQPPSPSVIKVRLTVDDGGIRHLMAGGRARAMRLIRLDV